MSKDEACNSFSVTLATIFLKSFLFLQDFFFSLLSDGTEKKRHPSTKAVSTIKGDPTSPWRRVDMIGKELMTAPYSGVQTLADLWRDARQKHSSKECMGTRQPARVHAEKQANGRVLEKWEFGDYNFRSYAEVSRRVNGVASGLTRLGVPEKETVVIYSETREEWMTSALACFNANLPVVTVYATLGDEAVEYAIRESEAATVFTTYQLIPKVLKAAQNGAPVGRIVYFSSQNPDESMLRPHVGNFAGRVLSFDELLESGDQDVEYPPLPRAEDLAIIMYTSGSTGAPKGVMLTHANIVAAVAGHESLHLRSDDTFVAYLPLAHIYELCAEIDCLIKGARIGYSSAGTLFDGAAKLAPGICGDCALIRPTFVTAVPAVLDRVYKAAMGRVESLSPLPRALFRTCYEWKKARIAAGSPADRFFDRLMFGRVRGVLGGRVRLVMSGAAPLSADTHSFMRICFDAAILQGYGLTETCATANICDLDDLSVGVVGPMMTNVEIILDEWAEAGYSPLNPKPQGEILIGGASVAFGYFKNPEKTKEDFVFRGGLRYFATGDIGEIQDNGELKIIDRKKDLVKLSHGEYISLGKVEIAMQCSSFVETICAFGDSTREFIVALVVPNHATVSALAKQIGIDVSDWEKACRHEELVNAVHADLLKHSQGKLIRVEQPRKILLCSLAWTPETGLLTDALKLKRKPIEIRYKSEIEAMYA